VAVVTGFVPAVIVAHEQDDVRALSGGGGGDGEEGENEGKSEREKEADHG
jgi:hypothetical protein